MVGDVYAHILDEDRKQNAELFEEAFYKKYMSLDSEFYSNESAEKEESKEMEPWGSEGIRKIHVNNYYVYFWINEPEQTVIVTAVIYAARDQIRQLEQMKKGINEMDRHPVTITMCGVLFLWKGSYG